MHCSCLIFDWFKMFQCQMTLWANKQGNIICHMLKNMDFIWLAKRGNSKCLSLKWNDEISDLENNCSEFHIETD